jgi:hypothetical protein
MGDREGAREGGREGGRKVSLCMLLMTVARSFLMFLFVLPLTSLSPLPPSLPPSIPPSLPPSKVLHEMEGLGLLPSLRTLSLLLAQAAKEGDVRVVEKMVALARAREIPLDRRYLPPSLPPFLPFSSPVSRFPPPPLLFSFLPPSHPPP